jgi:putative oxidoreductase
MAASSTGTAADAGRLLLRASLGVFMLFHGIEKVMSGPAGIVGLVEKAGLPGPLGYLVYIGEVLAPLLLVVGLWTRAAAAVVAINMVVAVYLVHVHELFTLSKTGGWALELQGFYFFTALAVMLLGAGRFSVGGAGGRFN